MTVSMRVMSAGDGYKYLLRTVASGDGDRSLSTPLTRYYAEEGTPPGRWLGSGLAALRYAPAAGDEVSEAQVQLLVGMGRHPITGEPLGLAYPVYRSVAQRVEDRARDLDPGLSPEDRAKAMAGIETEEVARGRRRAVAGYGFTFSVPKSASVLWGVADAGTQALIAQAHHEAVADVVAFIEREVAATRTGATAGDGAVAQVEVSGLIATGFDHYDSRAGDPHLHTHVVISNKVQTVLDGRWRSLDGRPMHAAVVALSELHEALFADRLTRALGVEWEARDKGRDRNPAWAITSVPEELVAEFSTRSRHIDAETDRLIAQYVAGHGRRPSTVTITKLRAQATLATRPEKQTHSLAELTGQWRQRAGRLLGEDAEAWAQRVTATAMPLVLRADDVPLDLVARLGRDVVEAVGEKRSTWRRWSLMAEAARQTMGWRFASTLDREAITALVVDSAQAASLLLTPPELATSPAAFRRDGSSVFRPRHSTLFSSEALLVAEDRLLARSRATTGPALPIQDIERATQVPDHEGRRLSSDQAAALAKVAVSGRVVDVLVGPAGAGKTTAMNALRRAWEEVHGVGSIVGLAPSAVAAHVLAVDLGIECENTAKWWHEHQAGRAGFVAGQLIIVDESSLAGTMSLDRITQATHEAGAKVLLVGDWAQLQAVDAGGAFALLAHDRDDIPELVDVHRFTQLWEKTASLDLRHGHPDAIDTYIAHDRVRGGETEIMVDAAYTEWRADTLAGRSSILVTESGEAISVLNARARADLILDGTVDARAEVRLHDDLAAGIGDIVITRRNDRRLRAGRTWVRNGERWTVTDVRTDGSIAIRPAGRPHGVALVLPARYVAEHVDLGYAITANRAQGVTTDSAHVLVTPTTTRESLYVAMTRGRRVNLAYVATDRPDESHAVAHPGDNPEATARTVLLGVLMHTAAEPSAHQAIKHEQETWGSIAQLAAEYETIAAAAQHDRWATLIRTCGLSPNDAESVITSNAFGALTAQLRTAEANHHDVDSLLPRLVRARSLSDAEDLAAVLHDRLSRATRRPAGSGRTRRPPRLIAGLIPEAAGPMLDEMRTALDQRRRLIEDRADHLLERALQDNAPWTASLGRVPSDARGETRWRGLARVVAAYRDRYSVIGDSPLGVNPSTLTQQVDASRAKTALRQAKDLGAGAGWNAEGPSRPQTAPELRRCYPSCCLTMAASCRVTMAW